MILSLYDSEELKENFLRDWVVSFLIADNVKYRVKGETRAVFRYALDEINNTNKN